MRELLDFKTKRDRDDFLIAIVVIAIFFGLFYGMIGGSSGFPEELQAAVPAILPADADGDNIPDDTDRCPNLAGVLLNEGCPADVDNDGVYDDNDKCPSIAGTAANMGCPLDGDNDGVPDGEDKCPNLAGISANNGCPADADKDGVYDVNDKCPDLAGMVENGGCPEIKLNKEETTLLNTAMRNVEFQTASANLKPVSTATLDKIVALMSKYPKYKLDIDGYTDNVGDANNNVQLSSERARSCRDYLVKAGIASSRMSYKGFGQRSPVASNDTTEGRRQNRRVEFNLHY